ncbi:hypothetical protein BC830DRAFT_470571 [Chytriomyces sp. MP71]|nr:hypothetical protein BC830DRAFT_470571 [Chytriomyces sp. MP71]
MDTEEDDQSGIMETIPESDAPEEVASDPKRSGFVTAPQGAFPGEDGTQQDEKNPITDEKANHGSVSFHIDTLEASWDGSAEETSGTIHQAVPSVEVDASAYPNNRFKKGRDATVEVRESVPPEQGHATQDHQRHPSSDAYPTTYPAHYLNPAAIFPVTVKKSLDHLLDPLEASIHPPLHHTPSSILPAAQVSPFKLPPTQPKRVLLKAREFVIGEARSRTPVYTGEDGGLDPETEAAWMAKIAADEDAALLAYARKHANEDFAEKVRAVVERHRRGILVPYMLDGVSMVSTKSFRGYSGKELKALWVQKLTDLNPFIA